MAVGTNNVPDLILSFCDVEGNYFTVLGYRYVYLLYFKGTALTVPAGQPS